MDIKDEKANQSRNLGTEKSDINDLQKQIDALVHGKVPSSSGSLRDLAKKPKSVKESGK